jgi:hypothetical protein
MNGAIGVSDIDGKSARVAVSERDARESSGKKGEGGGRSDLDTEELGEAGEDEEAVGEALEVVGGFEQDVGFVEQSFADLAGGFGAGATRFLQFPRPEGA